MRLTYSLRKILKPLSLGMVLYIICALIFVGVYAYVDYRGYFSSHQAIQQVELAATQNQLRFYVESLRKLSVLMSHRITSSQGDLKRIQNILNSSHSLLPNSDSLKIEKVTYSQLTKPQSRITRFGALSLRPEHIPSETPHQNGPNIVFHETGIICKSWVFNAEGNLEGFLEIALDPLSFKTALPMGSELSFAASSHYTLLQEGPFPIYGKIPDLFWEYLIKQRVHYAVFILFMLFSLSAFSLNTRWLWRCIKKVSRDRITYLTSALSTNQTDLEKTRADLFSSQQRTKIRQVALQAYKKFQMSFNSRQEEHLDHLLRSLDGIMNSYTQQNSGLHPEDLIGTVESCLKMAEALREGRTLQMSNEFKPIKILKSLESIQKLFIEKIHTSNLEVDISCSENLLYYGDPICMELALINIVGKAIHSVLPHGKIIVKVTNQKEGLHMHVKDNGFSFDRKVLNQVNQSFDFFLPQETFRKFCKENSLLYTTHRAKNGFNIAKIVFPKSGEQTLEGKDNVVPFIRKS